MILLKRDTTVPNSLLPPPLCVIKQWDEAVNRFRRKYSQAKKNRIFCLKPWISYRFLNWLFVSLLNQERKFWTDLKILSVSHITFNHSLKNCQTWWCRDRVRGGRRRRGENKMFPHYPPLLRLSSLHPGLLSSHCIFSFSIHPFFTSRLFPRFFLLLLFLLSFLFFYSFLGSWERRVASYHGNRKLTANHTWVLWVFFFPFFNQKKPSHEQDCNKLLISWFTFINSIGSTQRPSPLSCRPSPRVHTKINHAVVLTDLLLSLQITSKQK